MTVAPCYDVEPIKIPLHRYNQLIEYETTLHALWAGGVDNWEGYHESLKQAGLTGDEDDWEEED